MIALFLNKQESRDGQGVERECGCVYSAQKGIMAMANFGYKKVLMLVGDYVEDCEVTPILSLSLCAVFWICCEEFSIVQTAAMLVVGFSLQNLPPPPPSCCTYHGLLHPYLTRQSSAVVDARN